MNVRTVKWLLGAALLLLSRAAAVAEDRANPKSQPRATWIRTSCKKSEPDVTGARAAIGVTLRDDGTVVSAEILKALPASFGAEAAAWALTCSFRSIPAMSAAGQKLVVLAGIPSNEPDLILGGAGGPKKKCAPISMPEAARQAGIQGLVLVDFVIEPDGEVFEVGLKNRTAPPILFEAVAAWLRGCPFEPTVLKETGRPARVRMVMPFNFSLRDHDEPPPPGAAMTRPLPTCAPWKSERQGSGLVVVEYVVRADGTVSDVKLRSKIGEAPDLFEAVKRWLEKCPFMPSRKPDGTAVPVKMVQPFHGK